MSYSHSSAESEFFLSSEDSSSTEKEIYHNTGRDETKKVKGMKIAISILSVLLVFFATLSIVFLVTTYYSYRKAESTSISGYLDTKNNHETGFVYPFIKSSKGETTLRGHVTLDEPITEPFDLYSGSNEDETFLVYESDEKDNNLYEVSSDSFCCSSRRDSESCGKKVNEDTLIIPARTEEEAQRIALKLLKDKEFGTKQERLCHSDNPLVSFIQSSSQVPQLYHCHAMCQPSTMEYFLEHNPGAVSDAVVMMKRGRTEIGDTQVNDPQLDQVLGILLLKKFLDEVDTQCFNNNADLGGTPGEEFDSIEEAEKSAGKVFNDVCGSIVMTLSEDKTGEKMKYGHMCQLFNIECRPGPECWLGGHSDKGFQEHNQGERRRTKASAPPRDDEDGYRLKWE